MKEKRPYFGVVPTKTPVKETRAKSTKAEIKKILEEESKED